MTDDDPITTVTYCPGCGEQTAFDFQGAHTKQLERIIPGDGPGTDYGAFRVEQTWSTHRCPECGATFKMLDSETEEEITADDVLP